MPPKKLKAVKKDNGTYSTSDLNEKQFIQLFGKIQKAQNKARRSAKRTLRPTNMRKPTNKSLKALGEKVKGVGFTKKDLQEFDKSRQNHQKKFNSREAGITYGQIVSFSRDIDIKRANNQVDDGSGITRAALSGIKANTALVRVKASMESKHEEHLVKIRFEEWDGQLVEPKGDDFVKAAGFAAAGRISFDCDCGRHQYWYRYLATMGNYALTPPKEFAFPKIRNPEMKGVACKHVLKAMAMMQSKAWHRILGKQMQAQAKRVSFGDDRKFTYLLNDDDKKQASKNRSTKVHVEKAKASHKQYQKAIKAMQKKVKNTDREQELIKRQAKKIRKQSDELQITSDQLQMANSIIKMQFQMLSDQYKSQGKTRKQALSDFAKQSNVSVNSLKGIVG